MRGWDLGCWGAAAQVVTTGCSGGSLTPLPSPDAAPCSQWVKDIEGSLGEGKKIEYPVGAGVGGQRQILKQRARDGGAAEAAGGEEAMHGKGVAARLPPAALAPPSKK